MNINEAMQYLSTCTRWELRDHAFGDVEMGWEKDGQEVASGYFGGRHAGISVGEFNFEGEDAYKLRDCGVLGLVERNDETGPDTYSEGNTMRGLTLEGVYEELTNMHRDEKKLVAKPGQIKLPEVKPLTEEQQAIISERKLQSLANKFGPRHDDKKSITVTKIDNNGWNNRSAGEVNWDKAEAKRDDFVSTATSGKKSKKAKK